MKAKSATRLTGIIGDKAVRAATGKSWPQWFKLLDAAGAKKLDHKGIVALVSDQQVVRAWWRQMVAVQYERERGLREVHQTPRGFQVSVSRTFGVPVGKLYAAWQDVEGRGRWLPDAEFTLRKAARNKYLRITWPDATNVEVNFYAKPAGRSQCVVQHDKLPGAKAVERVRKLWTSALDGLRATVQPYNTNEFRRSG